MKTTLKILSVIAIAALYHFVLMDFSLTKDIVFPDGTSVTLNVNYIFRDVVQLGLAMKIVPSVFINIFNKVSI